MPVDENGAWQPGLFPKQWELLRACVPGPQNILLVNGPRKASKTYGCHHAVAQHAWNTDRGNICVLTITQSVGIDSGVWQHLTESFLPEWINGEFGMKWVKEPYVQNVTKKPACEVSNVHGNKTTIKLESLRNEDEVEDRFKGKIYSMIWVNELSKFKKRKTFDTLRQCLERCPHLSPEQTMFLADTNPDLDLGQQSWIYYLWYEFRVMTDAELLKMEERLEIEAGTFAPLRDALQLMEFTVDDNLAMTDRMKAKLRADFAHDKDLLAAYYYGKWVTASTDALFYEVFRPAYHVLGEPETDGNKDPEILVPEDTCASLVTGWDPGGRNCAAVIAEPLIIPAKALWPELFPRDGEAAVDPQIMDAISGVAGKPDKKAPMSPDKEIPCFKFIDELVSVGEDFRLEDFVEQFVIKMRFWEQLIARRIAWRHWGDRMIWDSQIPFTDVFWGHHIFECSGGEIMLMAERGNRGAVAARVDLWRKLLWEQRMWFSAAKCPHMIMMNKSIKRGSSSVAVIQKQSPWKHGFDAGSYLISSECYDELSRSVNTILKIRRRSEGVGLVSVPL